MTDDQIVESLRTSNEEYRELEESHHRLDLELQQLLKHHVLTPQEETVKKHIQKSTEEEEIPLDEAVEELPKEEKSEKKAA